MDRWWSALVAMLLLAATPALASSCTTQGTVDAPIVFPRNDASDVQFARSMVAAMLPHISGALPRGLGCTRTTVSTALGAYVIGGENGDAFPRMAVRADGGAGPVAYLAASPDAPGIFALVVHPQGRLTVVKRFYAGIPTDRLFTDDVRAALADDTGIMAYEAGQKLVTYMFERLDAVPPPRESGGGIAAGPQIFIPDSGDPRLLDMGEGMRHRPSGFACPERFDGLAVLLMTIEPNADSLSCDYRAGTDPAYREDEPIRYRITLIRPARGETAGGLFEQLAAEGRKAMRITGDHPLPLATGPAPAPQFGAFWDTESDGVQGIWVAGARRWIAFVRAQYPPGAANDAEARKVAEALFAEFARHAR